MWGGGWARRRSKFEYRHRWSMKGRWNLGCHLRCNLVGNSGRAASRLRVGGPQGAPCSTVTARHSFSELRLAVQGLDGHPPSHLDFDGPRIFTHTQATTSQETQTFELGFQGPFRRFKTNLVTMPLMGFSLNSPRPDGISRLKQARKWEIPWPKPSSILVPCGLNLVV